MKIPAELESGLSRWTRESAEPKVMGTVSILLYAFLFFITFQYRYSTTWTFVLAPAVGPLAAAVFFAVHPLNPYKGAYAELEGKQEALIMGEASAQRLVSLLASRQARVFVLKAGLLNSLILASVAVVAGLFLPRPISSAYSGEVFIECAFLFAVASVGLQGHFLLRWAFRYWEENAG